MLTNVPRNCMQDIAPRVFDAVLSIDARNWPDDTAPRTDAPVRLCRLAGGTVLILRKRNDGTYVA